MNQLYVGLKKKIESPKGSYLFIHDAVPELKRARVFDPLKHSFNPLKGITYKKAREIAEVLYTTSPQGEATLTVRNGKRALLKALLATERLDRWEPEDHRNAAEAEVKAMLDDLLASPVLRKVLCNPTNFSFNERSVIWPLSALVPSHADIGGYRFLTGVEGRLQPGVPLRFLSRETRSGGQTGVNMGPIVSEAIVRRSFNSLIPFAKARALTHRRTARRSSKRPSKRLRIDAKNAIPRSILTFTSPLSGRCPMLSGPVLPTLAGVRADIASIMGGGGIV